MKKRLIGRRIRGTRKGRRGKMMIRLTTIFKALSTSTNHDCRERGEIDQLFLTSTLSAFPQGSSESQRTALYHPT